MPTADSSHTARITRVKSQKLAAFRASFPSAREQGPGGQTTDYTTTYIWSRLGAKPFYGVGANGLQTDAGCCGSGGGSFSFVFNECPVGKPLPTPVTAGTAYTFTNNTGSVVEVSWLNEGLIISTLTLMDSNPVTKPAPLNATSFVYACILD